MGRIIPAIIPADLPTLERELAKVRPFTQDVQIDIVDGVFVANRSWPYYDGDTIADAAPVLSGFSFGLDLMIERLEATIDEWLILDPVRVVVHLEAVEDHSMLVRKIRSAGVAAGASIGNDTALTTLTTLIDMGSVDFVQLMGIKEIGSQGQPFDERVLTRAAELKSRYPKLPLVVDGSVNTETIEALARAGFERFVSGSAILDASDPGAAFKELEARADTGSQQ